MGKSPAMADNRSAALKTFAPAKINLFLHVLGRRADGYHDLESLVAFASIGDELTFIPGEEFSLRTEGRNASELGSPDRNLIAKAVRALRDEEPHLTFGQFTLVKHLPIAAGLGGGSADAAAALRLLAKANGLSLDDARVIAAARRTGADVSVCLESQTRLMRGTGETLSPPTILPPLPAILITPNVAVPTASVFAELRLASEDPRAFSSESPSRTGSGGGTDSREENAIKQEDKNARRFNQTLKRFGNATSPLPVFSPDDLLSLTQQLDHLANDLEAAAIRLFPPIAEALNVTGALQDCLLARMSGSGSTVFGLFPDAKSAARAARTMKASHPDWWIAQTILGHGQI